MSLHGNYNDSYPPYLLPRRNNNEQPEHNASAANYEKSLHNTSTAAYYTSSPLNQPSLPPHLHQQPNVAFTHSQSFSVTDPQVSPPPPLHNQPSANSFQYSDADNDLGDVGDLPILRAPSARLQESISLNVPGQYNAQSDDDLNNIRYGHIPQRVPRRIKTLKRVEYVFPRRASSADLTLTLCNALQALPWQLCPRLRCANQAAQPLRVQR